MKRTLSFLLAAVLVLTVTLTASAEKKQDTAANSATEGKYAGILASDKTAIDFLEGYWTNGRGDYILAVRGESALINWQMSLPYPECSIYVLENGKLVGRSLSEKSEIVESGVITIDIVDDDTVSVKSLITGECSEFTRDSFEIDGSNITDAYVFRTMARALAFMDGEWRSEDLDYIYASLEKGAFLTSLPIPENERIDFCDYELCSVKTDDKGRNSFTPLYSFAITGRNGMEVVKLDDGTSYSFRRVSEMYEFLAGEWREEEGDEFFIFDISENGDVSMRTGFDVGQHYSYVFANNRVYAEDNSEGAEEYSELFRYDIIDEDKIEFTVCTDERTYILVRRDAE